MSSKLQFTLSTMSRKIFELKDLQRVDTFTDTPPRKKKRHTFANAVLPSSSISSPPLNSLVDPIWETVDPTPDLFSLFKQYDDTFFDGKLAACEVKWSPRMTACAGVCSFERKGRFCSIRLSKPLLQYRPRKDMVETLLHEMIHAFLFLSGGVTDRDGHGPMFRFHMHRINLRAGTNITIYHNFHNEVTYHQKHWWRCVGPCRMRPPFYGWVKRSMNRAPGMNDFWWKEHQMTCGGTFIKVKEPEAYGLKKKSSGMSLGKSQSQTRQTSLTGYFTGIGHVLGHQSSSSDDTAGSIHILQGPKETVETDSMKPEHAGNCKTVSTAKEDRAGMRKIDPGLLVNENRSVGSARDGNIEIAGNDIIVCVPCPICNTYVSENAINPHLDSCLTKNS